MSDSLKLRVKWRKSRLLILASLVLPTAWWAMSQVFIIFQPNEFRPLEWVQLVLTSILFLWLAMSFWTAIIGFLLKLFKRDPLTLGPEILAPQSDLALSKQHAIVMPVYNEETPRIMSGFESAVLEIQATEGKDSFDFYMLSDTQDTELLQAERALWQKMLARLPVDIRTRCYYRNREKNIGRKVGNVKDFCQRWGYLYESMIVLDADSMMSGSKMLELAQRLECNPKLGLIQTIPMPARESTFFGRFVQFAAQVYSPMLASGLSFWQGDCANYWGHNAIIRMQAFLDTCGLPPLKGKQPFGGDILSHDFVEAALLRRANWQVFLLTDDKGSYEEVPSNIIDYATRDRRWVQGNMQHLSIVGSKGLHMANRLHFLFGAFAYASSILLLLVLLTGTADALIQAFSTPVYFTQPYQLFPTWYITKQNVMIATLIVTLMLLFFPKLLGIIISLIQRRKDFGGGFNFLKSAVIEFFFAMLLAPVMMMYHSYFVLNVLAGKSVKWEAQAREGRMLPWSQCFKFSFLLSLIGLVWAGITLYYVPTLFYWLLPVTIGLVLSAPILRFSSSIKLGLWCKDMGIFLLDTEVKPNRAIKSVNIAIKHLDQSDKSAEANALPETKFSSMPLQPLSRGIYEQDESKELARMSSS